MYRTVTEGKFSEALRQVNGILWAIPLTVVDSRREVDDVKELLSIVKCAAPGLPECLRDPERAPPTALCAAQQRQNIG
jgi:hypothetical protein